MRFDIPESLTAMQHTIVTALRTVIDPELHVNVVDLGLIYHVKVDTVLILVEMTLSSKNCPMSESIVSGVKNSLLRVFSGYEVQVNLVWKPEWNYRTIPAEGIKKLRGR